MLTLRNAPLMLNPDVFGLTHAGAVRQQNEDQFLVANLATQLRVQQGSVDVAAEAQSSDWQGYMFVVADGMGGRLAGERASAVVVCSLADSMLNTLRWHFRPGPRRGPEVMADLREAVLRCQRQIGEESRLKPSVRGMGTTVTLAYILWPQLFVVHVGDSRCYVLRNRKLRQLTRDHTWAQLMVDHARMSQKEAKESRFKNILWNVVGGGNDDLQPDIFCDDVELGDVLLLCSDGLTKHVTDDQIAGILQQDLPAERLCQKLIGAAISGGGTDNVTAIVARFPLSLEESRRTESRRQDDMDGRRTACDLSATLGRLDSAASEIAKADSPPSKRREK